MPKSRAKQFVLPFDKITIKDIPLVGGKGASLGEMYQRLTPRGVKVPPGFAVTAYAYRYLLKKAKLEKKDRIELFIESEYGLSNFAEEIKDKVEADLNDARTLGVNSTPTFYLNGTKVNLANFDDLKTQVEKSLR